MISEYVDGSDLKILKLGDNNYTASIIFKGVEYESSGYCELNSIYTLVDKLRVSDDKIPKDLIRSIESLRYTRETT